MNVNWSNGDWVKGQYQEFDRKADQAEAAKSVEAWNEVISAWNQLEMKVGGEYSRRHFRLCQDVGNAQYEQDEKLFREQIMPVVTRESFVLKNKLLKSRLRPQLSSRWNAYFFDRTERMLDSSHATNADLMVKDGELNNQYTKKVAQAQVEVQGKKVTLAVARNLASSENAEVRHAAFQASRTWYVENRLDITELFEKLVQNRQKMATNLGHATFTPLGYSGMCRTDYGPNEVSQFRDAILEFVTPLQTLKNHGQAKALGTSKLHAKDVGYDPRLSLPSGVIPVGKQLDAAQRVFDQLSPKLGGHFSRMRKEELIDLENRPGKRAGAFCTSFPDEQKVAIFCNSTGDADDVRTLMHEMGHAFQAWESQRIELADLRWPTMDGAEIFSMGMEFLSQPHLGEFFEPSHLERFKRKRWAETIDILCHIACVDEFQHWVYQNPNSGTQARDQAWNDIFKKYQPSIDFEGREDFRAARWHMQPHIFGAPFYYIDYGIAETGAMQLALMSEKDPKATLESYLGLCELGGTVGVLELFRKVGMRSPFDKTLMRDLMKKAAHELAISV